MRFIFFSSRRRHSRFDCDWSSDVCSSDLRALGATDWQLGREILAEALAVTLSGGADRKSVVKGKSVDLGGRRIIKKKKKKRGKITTEFDRKTRVQRFSCRKCPRYVACRRT